MKLAVPFTTQRTAAAAADKPRDDELDLYGLTHPGRVRKENEDQFLLCTVNPQVVVHGTSLPDAGQLAARAERMATLLLVADGVGGSAAGSLASQLATEAITRHVVSSLRCYQTGSSPNDKEFVETLRRAAASAHDAVRAEAVARDHEKMATTLSLGIVIWPWLYVVQVGDSRCYLYQGGALRQITRDQTLAQELVDRGVMSREGASRSPFNDVLASAIGASDVLPEITRVDVRERGCVILVCTDGLTKHVSDGEIAQCLERMTSAEQAAHALLDLALERGGSDNVTVVIGRALKRAAD